METPNIWEDSGIWIVYLGFVLKVVYIILGLLLYIRLMKWLKLHIELLQYQLEK